MNHDGSQIWTPFLTPMEHFYFCDGAKARHRCGQHKPVYYIVSHTFVASGPRDFNTFGQLEAG
jgi:hypothetical protein